MPVAACVSSGCAAPALLRRRDSVARAELDGAEEGALLLSLDERRPALCSPYSLSSFDRGYEGGDATATSSRSRKKTAEITPISEGRLMRLA